MPKPVLLVGLRALGALSLLAVAAVHFYEYHADHYSAIPTIGTLFLLNGAGATALALILMAPVKIDPPGPNCASASPAGPVERVLVTPLWRTLVNYFSTFPGSRHATGRGSSA